MMSILVSISRGFRNSIRQATELGVKYSRIGRIRFEIVAIKKEVEELLIEVGGRVYDRAVHGEEIRIASDKELQQRIERIRELETELKDLKLRLDEIEKTRTMTGNI